MFEADVMFRCNVMFEADVMFRCNVQMLSDVRSGRVGVGLQMMETRGGASRSAATEPAVRGRRQRPSCDTGRWSPYMYMRGVRGVVIG